MKIKKKNVGKSKVTFPSNNTIFNHQTYQRTDVQIQQLVQMLMIPSDAKMRILPDHS